MARSKLVLFFMLVNIYNVTAQSYGTVPTTLTRIESKLDDVSETSTHLASSTDQMGSVLNVTNQHLHSLSDLHVVQTKILQSITEQQDVTAQSYGTVPTTLTSIESKLYDVSETSTHLASSTDQLGSVLNDTNQHLHSLSDLHVVQTKILQSITEQQDVQNQILGVQTDLLRQLSTHNAIQNQIMNKVLDLLQQQNEQIPVISQRLDNATEQNLVQNQILTSMTDVLQVQDNHMENLTEGVLQQTEVFSTMASSLQNISESMHRLANNHMQGHETPNSAFPTWTVPTPTTLSSQESPSPDSTRELFLSPDIAENCQNIFDQCLIENYGIHQIQPVCSSESFNVVCDLNTAPGGWIVFQRRFNGSVDFYRGWEEYRQGFGDLNGEFWLGLEKIHNITRRGTWQLRIELESYSYEFIYIEYNNFNIGDESTNYRLTMGEYYWGYSDALYGGTPFSTYDQDHDHESHNCASIYHGAWWCDYCDEAESISNLNGRYNERLVESKSGMTWPDDLDDDNYSFKKSEMKIRQIY